MSKTVITAHIVDQTVQLSNLPKLASGSVDVVQIQCDFCPLWDGYGKTAVFYKEQSQVYHILLVDDLVTIPHEMLAEEGSFFFGVMGVEDNTRTTEVLRLNVVQGAITLVSAEAKEPTPDIYQQLMTRMGQLTAMRSTGGAVNYTLSDEYILGKIVSNGASAYIDFTISQMSLVAGGHHYTDYCIIPELAPLCQMELRCSNPDINVTLEMPSADSEGWARLLIENVGNTMLTTDEINTASTVYPLTSVSIAELADVRVGHDGTPYPTAGDSVRGQVQSVAKFFQQEKSANLFNMESAENQANHYVNYNNGSLTAYNYYVASHYIPVQNGKTYTTKAITQLFGEANAAKICGYNVNKEFVAVTVGTLSNHIYSANGNSSRADITFTISNADIAYVRVTVPVNELGEFMFVEGDSYPEEYQPYFEPKCTLVGVDIPGNNRNEHFTEESIVNLYNPEDADIVYGKSIDRTGVFSENAYFDVSGFIPVEYGKKYTFPVYDNYWGTQVQWVPCFNADKTYFSLFTGVLDTEKRTVTIENIYSNVKYIRVNIASSNTRRDMVKTVYHNPGCFMVVEGDTLPAEYIPFGTFYRMAENHKLDRSTDLTYNPLSGKRIVFTGDSIGEGTSAGDGLSGWAGRIGRKNEMLWMNKSVSGATITTGTSASTFITDTDFGPNPEYIILEGGTNDADILGDARTTPPAKFGTYSITDYTSEFDKTTFCGAVESLFKRATTDYAGAKIGFIIAPKMSKLHTGAPDYTAQNNNRRKYFETIIELCKKWGVPYLNLWDGCCLNPMNPAHFTSGESRYYTDGQHLTTAGYDYITPMIEAWIKTL